MTRGAAVSKPTTSSMPESLGSPIEKPFETNHDEPRQDTGAAEGQSADGLDDVVEALARSQTEGRMATPRHRFQHWQWRRFRPLVGYQSDSAV